MIPKGMQGQYAGFISRAIAFIVDILIVVVVIVVLSLAIALPLEQFLSIDINNCPPVAAWQDLLNLRTLTCLAGRWARIVLAALAAPVYYTLFWTMSGQTPAQYLMGLRVVRTDGRRMVFLRSVIRFVGYFASLVTVGLGFLWVLIDDRRQGLHDKMARTVVVYSWEARQNERLLDRVRRRFRRLAPTNLAAVQQLQALRSGQMQADLILCSFADERSMAHAVSAIQSGIRESQIEIIVSVELVKDEQGRVGLMGVSDLAEGTTTLPEEVVARIEQQVRQLDVDALFATVPDSTFMVLLVVDEAKSAQAIKFLSGEKIAARLYDLERFTRSTAASTSRQSPAPVLPAGSNAAVPDASTTTSPVKQPW
jgi:uncharacterized RDD family membrane protein YckC